MNCHAAARYRSKPLPCAKCRGLKSLLCLAVALAGCSSTHEPEMLEVTPVAASASSPPINAPNAAKPQANSPRAPDLADPKELDRPSSAAFTPPFPERELFEPPKQAKNAVRRDDEHGETVELKGFITVDEPRVVLSIGGVIAMIPEGGEKYGVRVISIQPPTVMLERGRTRWPATLE